MQKPKVFKIIEKHSPPKLLDITDKLGHYMQDFGNRIKTSAETPKAYKVGVAVSLLSTGLGLAVGHVSGLPEYASNNPVLKPLENIADNFSNATGLNITKNFFGGTPENDNILFWRPLTYGGLSVAVIATVYAGGKILEKTGELLVSDRKKEI
jgi:hypothetical protein